MKRQVLKEITACDFCGQEICTSNHRFVDDRTEVAYDLHADCMKKAVIEAIRARKGYQEPTDPMPVYQGATCKGCYALGTACGRCERCDKDPMNPKNNVKKS